MGDLPDLAPVERLAMQLSANSIFMRQGFAFEVLRSEWIKLRSTIDECLSLDIPPAQPLTVNDPIPRHVLDVMSSSHEVPDDISGLFGLGPSEQ